MEVCLFGLVRRLAKSFIFILYAFGFRLPEKGPSPNSISFRGQLLGFYGSWPVFTLTHHMLVWYAAWRIRPGVKFLDYALLGDDNVIADPVVAKSYL